MKVSVNGKEEERLQADAASHQAGPKTQEDVISFLVFFTKGGKKGKSLFCFCFFQSKFHRVELFLIF